jgi:hypothetical protein
MDRVKRQGARLVAILLAATGVSCALVPLPAAPLECGFREGTILAFAGRTTLRQLGLSADDPAADLNASVYVTAEPIPFSGSVPAGAEPPPDQRAYCALFDDGAGILSAHGGVPVDWRPPGS